MLREGCPRRTQTFGRSPVRAVTFLAFLIVLLLTQHTDRALADSYSRQRTGTSRWSPQGGSFEAKYHDEVYNRLTWRFGWYDTLHDDELKGSHRAIELKARTLPGYADEYGDYEMDNFPEGSLPYRDTSVSDDDCCNFGYGAADANLLELNSEYYATVEVRKSLPTLGYYDIKWDVAASSRLDHDSLGCLPGERFCVFPDYAHNLLRGRQLRVRQDDTRRVVFNHNFLYNQSFEQGLTQYGFLDPSSTKSLLCSGGFGSSCFLRLARGGGSAASVYQDVSYGVRVGDHFTSEVMLRCPSNTGPCSAELTYWGLGGFQEQEHRSVPVAIPNDFRWYHCRLDFEHGAGLSFERIHSKVRWEVYNTHSFRSIDIDFTTLANHVDRTDRTAGDPAPPPDSLAPCVLADQYNG